MSALKKQLNRELFEATDATETVTKTPENRLLRVFAEVEEDAAERRFTYLKDSEALADGE